MTFDFGGNECIQQTVWESDTEYAILCRLMQVTIICDKETIDVCVCICLYGHLGSGVTGKKLG